MKESIYKSYDELPLFLNAETVAKNPRNSQSSAYELMHEKDFPALKIGNRIVVPNELFVLRLSAGEIAVYAFLMRCENRDNYTCVVSYKEIGAAVGMSKNTVSKYVAMLEECLLIETQHTSVFTQEGLKGNGKLRYKILPIQGAIDEWNRRGLARFKATGKFNVKMTKSRQKALPEKLPSS